uniref:PWI domain-containing protein n=1 Tax=Steinernema glaseri TaxID=37863 RepID=A0A1I7YTT5_9BILA
MWSDILENLTPLGVSDELALLVRHFLAVPFNGTYVQLAHALLREMEREQVVPLKPDLIEALLTVQINGPSLGLFDPRLHAELWLANGNIAADDEGSEPSEKMQMALGRIPRGDTNVDAFSDIAALHGGDDDEEWEAPISRKRREFDVEKFLEKYDYFFQ